MSNGENDNVGKDGDLENPLIELVLDNDGRIIKRKMGTGQVGHSAKKPRFLVVQETNYLTQGVRWRVRDRGLPYPLHLESPDRILPRKYTSLEEAESGVRGFEEYDAWAIHVTTDMA